MITSDSPFPYLDESECVLIFAIGKESKFVKIGRPISDRPSGFQTTFSAVRGKSLTHVCVCFYFLLTHPEALEVLKWTLQAGPRFFLLAGCPLQEFSYSSSVVAQTRKLMNTFLTICCNKKNEVILQQAWPVQSVNWQQPKFLVPSSYSVFIG